MASWYEKYYWRTGFKTSLYDWLTPESYFESMRQTIALLPYKVGQKIWDVGCGSGLLLRFFKENFNRDVVYYGSDLLFTGLQQVKIRAKELKVSGQVICVQNDVTEVSPFLENSMDAHVNYLHRDSMVVLRGEFYARGARGEHPVFVGNGFGGLYENSSMENGNGGRNPKSDYYPNIGINAYY